MEGVVYKPYKPKKERSLFYIGLIVVGVLLILFGTGKVIARSNLRHNGEYAKGKVVMGSNHPTRRRADLFDNIMIGYKANPGTPEEKDYYQNFISISYYRSGEILSIYYDKNDPNRYIIAPVLNTAIFVIYTLGIIALGFGIAGTILGWKIIKKDYYRAFK